MGGEGPGEGKGRRLRGQERREEREERKGGEKRRGEGNRREEKGGEKTRGEGRRGEREEGRQKALKKFSTTQASPHTYKCILKFVNSYPTLSRHFQQ